MALAPDDIVITGLGPVTPVGVGCEALWDALMNRRTAVVNRALPVDIGETVDLPIASMPQPNQVPGLDKHLALLAGQDLGQYRDLAYALLAAELAVADAGLTIDRSANRVGMVQAFEAPGVEVTVANLFGMFSGPPPTDGPPKVYEVLAPKFYAMQPFLYVHAMAKVFGLHGFSTSVHNACSSGAFAIETAAQALRSGRADVMIVVGGEVFETAARLEWFKRLDLYARTHDMSPFASTPSGFYVGEGAGAIVLETVRHAQSRGASAYASYLGGAFAHQAWKQTIPDVRAARLAKVITQVLAATGVSPAQLDLIVPHGTATTLSDGYERECMAAALRGEAAGGVATTFKPFVGHMLAASGIVEMICAMLAVKNQAVPPTLNTLPDTARLDVPLASETLPRQVDTVMKLSTGFTGHDAASIYQRITGTL